MTQDNPVINEKLEDLCASIKDVMHGPDKRSKGLPAYCSRAKVFIEYFTQVTGLEKPEDYNAEAVCRIPEPDKIVINEQLIELDQIYNMISEKMDKVRTIEDELEQKGVDFKNHPKTKEIVTDYHKLKKLAFNYNMEVSLIVNVMNFSEMYARLLAFKKSIEDGSYSKDLEARAREEEMTYH